MLIILYTVHVAGLIWKDLAWDSFEAAFII